MVDRRSQTTGSGADRRGQTTAGSQKQSTPASSVGGGGGGRGGRRGGGGGGGTSKDDQKKTQAQLDNTGANYQKRKNDLDDITKGRQGDLEKTAAQRKADMDKIAKQQLNNINQQKQANDAQLKTNQRNIMQNIAWQPNQQKEQSTLMALRNRMGNSAYGSSIQDLAEGMGRVDDMNDVELINTWKQNENTAYANWFQANQSLVGDYNDQIASIQDEYSQFASDYADQQSKLNRDYQDQLSQLYSQYWSTMSNVNPELASAKNLKKAAQKAGTASADKEALKIAKNTQKAVKTALEHDYVEKTYKADLKKRHATPVEARAVKIIDKARKTNKGKAKAIKKAALKAAEDAVSKASKNAERVSVGKGSDKYYLPNVDLRSKADLTSNLKIDTSALGSLMKPWQNASSQNARIAAYVRPDAGRGDVLLGGANGAINMSRAANTGFTDNLAAFRRV